MQKIILSALLLLYLSCFDSYSQIQGQTKIDSLNRELSKCKEDSNKVRLLLKLSANLRGEDVQRAIKIDKQALALSKKIKYNSGIAKSLNGIGVGYYFIGNYAEAIMFWEEAKVAFTEIGQLKGVANILSNMGAIYFNQSEYTKAIELYLQALKIAEMKKDTLRIASVWQNIGAVHMEKHDYDLAIEAFEKALPLFKLIKNEEGIGVAYLNLGECYNGKEDYKKATDNLTKSLKYLPSTNYYANALRTMGALKSKTSNIEEALFYYDSAYSLALMSEDNFELARTVNDMANLYLEKSDWQKASRYFEKGKALSIASQANSELVISTSGLVKIYSLKGDFKKAFENQTILQNAKDSVYNQESDNKMNRLLFNFDLEKKENEISLLVKDKKIQQIEVEKQKGIRNMFIGGFSIVLLFSVVVYRQRNKVKREKKNVEKEKARSEELLLNILPQEVAEELKAKGSAEAKLINEVTVLFTDFKGFTQLSEKLTPKELVGEINTCFSAFDHIMQKYGVEKIKTIGDAYMAAGGLPTPNKTHAEDVVKAALEIQDFMHRHKVEKEAAGQMFFEIRIGVHTGAVVAGIVGIKKFAYDIWGDTVNTASRMESSGEVGKVNVSGSTYELVKDKFTCMHRGKITAKGKGEIDMYFVEGRI